MPEADLLDLPKHADSKLFLHRRPAQAPRHAAWPRADADAAYWAAGTSLVLVRNADIAQLGGATATRGRHHGRLDHVVDRPSVSRPGMV